MAKTVQNLRKIQAGGITKTITDYINNANGTQKIKFIPHNTQGGYVYIDVPEEAKEEKKKGKYITIAIENEENDIDIGIIRAENDIDEEEIEVHMAELSPRGFPITTG